MFRLNQLKHGMRGLHLPADETDEIKALMTPKDVLRRITLPEPEKILPGIVQCYDDLLERREQIRNLRLLPIKTDEDRRAYKEMDKMALLADLEQQMNGSTLALDKNHFPYYLPPDTLQLIIWVRNSSTSRQHIARFIQARAPLAAEG